MSALKKVLITLAALAALIAAIPLLIPYDNYKSDLERAMSARLESKVTVGNIHFSYEPKPQLALNDVRFGDDGNIGTVVVPVTLKNLLNFRSQLTDVSLQNASFKQAFALSLPGRLKPNPGRDIHFASLKLIDLNVQLQHGAIGPLSGVVKLNPDGTFKEITVTDRDERAQLKAKPLDDKFELEFEARNWVLPGAYEARFEQLNMSGIADRDGILIDSINGILYGSAAIGQAQLNWNEGWKLTGSLQTRSMQVEPLIMLASPTTRATGRMAASATFAFAGDSYETLFKQPHFELKFTVNDGNLHNFDIVTPLKSQNPSVLQRGGQTRFDTLSGDYVYDNGQVALQNLALNSGKFTAGGNLAIDAARKLSGRVNAKLASGVIVINAPLSIGGTLDAPEIRSAGAYKPGGNSDTTRIF